MTDRVSAAEYRDMVGDMMKENALQSQIITLAEELGWVVYHTHDSRRSNPGWPDLAMVHPSRQRFMVRELKTAKGRASKDQRLWLEWLSDAGVNAGMWRPSDLLDGTVLRELTESE